MSRIKLLLDVVEDMHSLANSIQAMAFALAENCATESVKEPDPPTVTDETEPQFTLEAVRAFLGQKSRDGYTDAVRSLLQQFGANKLSEVSVKDYAALMRAAEALDYGT